MYCLIYLLKSSWNVFLWIEYFYKTMLVIDIWNVTIVKYGATNASHPPLCLFGASLEFFPLVLIF